MEQPLSRLLSLPIIRTISPQLYANDVDGTNDFDVEFGYTLAADGIPQSEAMAANGWTTALKMTVNKDPPSSSVRLPVSTCIRKASKFGGNFALRFNMNLVEGSALTGTALSEFAEFGINHYGTNCNWISGDISTYGSLYTNIDGFWTAIASDAGGATGGTPPDYGLYSATTFPNYNVVYQPLSFPATQYSAQFKHPVPYSATGSGMPANQNGSAETSWANMEFRQLISGGSNIATISINKTVVLSLHQHDDLHQWRDHARLFGSVRQQRLRQRRGGLLFKLAGRGNRAIHHQPARKPHDSSGPNRHVQCWRDWCWAVYQSLVLSAGLGPKQHRRVRARRKQPGDCRRGGN